VLLRGYNVKMGNKIRHNRFHQFSDHIYVLLFLKVNVQCRRHVTKRFVLRLSHIIRTC